MENVTSTNSSTNLTNAMDPLTHYLQTRTSAEHIWKQNANELVANWEKCIDEIRNGYKGGLDDYLNDMDLRQIIADCLCFVRASFTPALINRIEFADKELTSLTKELPECLWGESLAERFDWTRANSPWYYRLPSPIPWIEAV